MNLRRQQAEALHILLYGSECRAVSKGEVHKIVALSISGVCESC